MKTYTQYIISQNNKELGLLFSDIQEHLLTPREYKNFLEFMRGQTCGLLGELSICYTGDFERFINKMPNID